MKCLTCEDELKSTRGKSGLCQPCSARELMNNKWSKRWVVDYLDKDTKTWLLNQANSSKVRLSMLVAGIIKDAYYEDTQKR